MNFYARPKIIIDFLEKVLPPLCKGRWQKSLIFDGGIVGGEYNFSAMITVHLTIPQSLRDSPLYTREAIPLDLNFPFSIYKGFH